MALKIFDKPDNYTFSSSTLGGVQTYGTNQLTGGNLTSMQVRNALGEGINGVAALCKSLNANKWAIFQSRTWDISIMTPLNGVFERKNRMSDFKLGDFIGYNHDAKSPVHIAKAPTQFDIEKWASVSFSSNPAHDNALIFGRGEGPPFWKESEGLISFENVRIEVQNGSANIEIRDIDLSISDEVGTVFSLGPSLGDVTIKGYYMIEELPGQFDRAAMCEFGTVVIPVITSPLLITGAVVLGYVTYDVNPFYVTLPWSIKRTSLISGRGLFYRIRAHGVGINPNSVYNIGYKYLNADEEFITTDVDALKVTSTTGAAGDIDIILEVAPDSGFSDSIELNRKTVYFSGGNPA